MSVWVMPFVEVYQNFPKQSQAVACGGHPRPYAKSSTALFPSLPVGQHATDVAHGVVNVTYIVELPLVEKILLDECGLSRTQWEAMYANVGADCGAPTTANDKLRSSSQTHYLERPISNAVSFFMDAKYLAILNMVDIEKKGFTRDNQGHQVALPKLIRAMFVLIRTMVKVAHTPHPKEKDITYFVSAAENLRNVLSALDTLGTVRVGTCLDLSHSSILGTVGYFVPFPMSWLGRTVA